MTGPLFYSLDLGFADALFQFWLQLFNSLKTKEFQPSNLSEPVRD
jgi:hypothetical protein